VITGNHLLSTPELLLLNIIRTGCTNLQKVVKTTTFPPAFQHS